MRLLVGASSQTQRPSRCINKLQKSALKVRKRKPQLVHPAAYVECRAKQTSRRLGMTARGPYSCCCIAVRVAGEHSANLQLKLLNSMEPHVQ